MSILQPDYQQAAHQEPQDTYAAPSVQGGTVITPQASVTEVQWHFAVPIYTKLLPGFESQQQPLLDLVRERFISPDATQEKAPADRSTLYNPWHSEANLHLLNHPAIQWFNREVGIMARDCIGSRNPQMSEFDVLMESCWATMCTQGGWSPPHNHFPAQWSGVLFLWVEQAINAEEREDKGGKIDFFNPVPLSAGFGLPTSVTYTPRDGLMLLFPALLQHMTHPLTKDTGRYSIAFNLNIVPRSNNRV
ncbi:MAG: putative 2OG-Fe(II) oxygenase [Vampirovibrionales bacterium]|nr:putative 2OG-Fe(II) oxygenase [Vampirovibrionales bacterium]